MTPHDLLGKRVAELRKTFDAGLEVMGLMDANEKALKQSPKVKERAAIRAKLVEACSEGLVSLNLVCAAISENRSSEAALGAMQAGIMLERVRALANEPYVIAGKKTFAGGKSHGNDTDLWVATAKEVKLQKAKTGKMTLAVALTASKFGVSEKTIYDRLSRLKKHREIQK